MWRIQIVEQEKERLLKEHAAPLTGFLHPELVERARRVASYANNPQAPDYLNNYRT